MPKMICHVSILKNRGFCRGGSDNFTQATQAIRLALIAASTETIFQYIHTASCVTISNMSHAGLRSTRMQAVVKAIKLPVYDNGEESNDLVWSQFK